SLVASSSGIAAQIKTLLICFNLMTDFRVNESLPLLAFLIRWYGVNMAGGLSSRCFVIQVQRYFF
ncbi:hypothetical protein, partial [Escherichia coli]|uniref:hypothetical protein n=1 Tax=Escherichia coli TaxID=562 RepID=UPI001B3A47F2